MVVSEMNQEDIEKIETSLLLETVFRRYGYDFRNYAPASLKRRLDLLKSNFKLPHLSDMVPRVLHDREFFNSFLEALSVSTTEMFRDPHFFLALRQTVFPFLRTYPHIKLWHAGCSTGEEVYSMAILLEEEGLLKRTQIYATDFNQRSLNVAREGIYSIKSMESYATNYSESGGKASLSDYFLSKYDSIKIHDFLKEKILFSFHNMVTDSSFGEMNLIVCRNVFIYFDKTLQNRILSLFLESLCHRGFLCLGDKESLDFSERRNSFELISKKEKIFRKK